jgi:hypothetical protein
MKPWDIELVKITNIPMTVVIDIKKKNQSKKKHNRKRRYK